MARLCILPARVLHDEAMTYKQLRALMAVGYFANRSNGGVWASNQTMAETAGLDERDLRRCLADLEARGYIRRTRRFSDDGGSHTSLVDLVLDEVGVQSGAPREGRITPGGEGRKAPGEVGRSAPPKDTEERQQTASTSPTTTGTAVTFQNPDIQQAYLAHRRASRHPSAFDAALRAILTGMTTGKPVAEEVLGLALMDMAANGEAFNASRIRGYIRKHEAAQLAPSPVRKPDVDEYGLSTKRLTPWTLSDSERAAFARESEQAAKGVAV